MSKTETEHSRNPWKVSHSSPLIELCVPYRDVFGDLHGELHGGSSHVDGAHGARPVHDLVVLGLVILLGFPVDVIELAEDVVDSQPLVHPLLDLRYSVIQVSMITRFNSQSVVIPWATSQLKRLVIYKCCFNTTIYICFICQNATKYDNPMN